MGLEKFFNRKNALLGAAAAASLSAAIPEAAKAQMQGGDSSIAYTESENVAETPLMASDFESVQQPEAPRGYGFEEVVGDGPGWSASSSSRSEAEIARLRGKDNLRRESLLRKMPGN